jgi:hypothetical protein
MLIANPIYDVVFKRLMENDKVAKFFISTLIGEEIESIEVKPQEFTYTSELAGLAVFRLDFIANIRIEDGSFKKILIEIQKAKNLIDLMRFRNYLGEQYKKEDIINGEKVILPITTIYILGFILPEIESACIRVKREYFDLINNVIIKNKSDFVEKITHDSFIIQVDRITDRYQSTLDKLLSVFEQNHFTVDNKIVKTYNYQTDIDEVNLMTQILHHTSVDPQERKNLENEEEAWRSVNAMFESKTKDLLKKMAEKDKALKEAKMLAKENEKAMKYAQKSAKEIEKAIKNKEKELADKDKLIAELLKKLESK